METNGWDLKLVEPEFDQETQEMYERHAQKKDWQFNEQLYPRKTIYWDEYNTFFREHQGRWKIHSTPKEQLVGRACFLGTPLRTFIVDSGASMHIICRPRLSPSENKTVRRVESPITIQAANGLVEAALEATIFDKGHE